MTELDYAALFAATPSPYLVLNPAFVIVEVNSAYPDATRRERDELIGRRVFDAVPDNPAEPDDEAVRNLNASLQRVLASRSPEAMAVQRYHVPIPDRPGSFEERWWSPINTPILAADGTVAWIIHRVEDVTAYVKHRPDRRRRNLVEREALEAELYARARQLEQLNEELREAHARERQVAVTSQAAMLQAPDLAHHDDVAVRYLQATGSLNVCGDWYDVVDLPDGRFAAAVGDVVGHGLEAASVMGMLRSALSAAIRTLERPAQALEVLGLYARSVEEALNTTVVNTMIDPRSQLIIYSSAGHPPPILLHPDGSCDLLDMATDPPLGARPDHVPRPQAGPHYTPGDTLVLYTDGLIERRGEDIDEGLARLTGALGRYTAHDPQDLADALLGDLGVDGGSRDDIALIVIRL
ncbi:SpoIIE family protein phosphatase [Actinospica durhamensis]|uniref:SpoIIE family protein phosphatase n=1 Tax=Actinospica durhamensis TaxID=1508375 RepID=A0A941ITX5_9ACTN|nr:SpoIIE family protein phosphatase [Actinospica durhamensis]MBR7834821.1 SpoIIE family protein phosphatase [Actinospica durhamensis]